MHEQLGTPPRTWPTPIALPSLQSVPDTGDHRMMQIVAVVDADGNDTVVIWHVDIGTEVPGMSRMCGAWVLPAEKHKVELLTRRRLIVATACGSGALSMAHCTPAGSLDLNRTLKMIEAERDRLQAIYDALPSTRKKTLVAPRSPAIPSPIDFAHPPQVQTPDELVATALGIAGHLDQLAGAWAGIERQRTARAYLTANTPDQSPDPRAIPLQIDSC